MNLNNAVADNSLISSFFNGDLVSNELTAGLAIASTAILGGAFYYYLKNDNTSRRIFNIIDHKNQTREIDVYKLII